MEKQQLKFSSATVSCYFDADYPLLSELADPAKIIIITDENIARLHSPKFEGKKVIVLNPGEENKQQYTVDNIIASLIKMKADRESFIIGVGGGVITDITGYVASVYMRGIKFGFVPTSILGMVDASVGGKNGVDVGIYKNLVGVIRHPEFLLYDYSLLETLPEEEWINGFAEIIKHACIKDEEMFRFLEENTPEEFMEQKDKTADLIKRNVKLKYNIVSTDEFEKGDRKLLNFGHTVGHAIENTYQLPHGHAISIGMVIAAQLSQQVGLTSAGTIRIEDLLKKYHLPVNYNIDKEKIWEVLLMDKKKAGDTMNFILLNKIGKGVVKPIQLKQLKDLLSL